MKQTRLFRLLAVFIVAGLSISSVFAQSETAEGNGSQQGLDQAAKNQIYVHQKYLGNKTPAEYEKAKLQNASESPRQILSSGTNMTRSIGGATLSTSTADRKEVLIKLRDQAIKNGLPTTKYDQELEKLNN